MKRELQNVMRGALIASSGATLLPSHLPAELMNAVLPNDEEIPPALDGDLVGWQGVPAELDRLLAKGYVAERAGDPTPTRGGRTRHPCAREAVVGTEDRGAARLPSRPTAAS